MAVFSYAYGLNQYGAGRYGGDHPFNVIASVERRGIPFIVGNDRYQIVLCDDPGTTDSAPSFRYWFAGPPMWDEALTHDPALPSFYALDEDDDPVSASLELPFRSLKVAQNMQIDGVMVEYEPMPASVEAISATVGFTVHIEGYGLQGYARQDGSYLTGVSVSSSFTVAEDQSLQDDDPWPNIRTAWCPVRCDDRFVAARAVFTDVTLCQIIRVQLIGDAIPARTA